MEAEMEEEIAELDDEIMDDEKGAITETMASELAAIEKKTPGDKPPGDEVTTRHLFGLKCGSRARGIWL